MKKWACMLLVMVLSGGGVGGAEKSPSNQQRVELKTSMGRIVLALYPDQAPKTVENFIVYVKEGFYNQTVFHRVIPGFMIQGGGFTAEMNRKATRPPITNEADNGLGNVRGTIAMARTSDPHSATAQFFINVADNPFLDFKRRSSQGWGYAVFGKVVSGMAVVDQISQTATATIGPHRNVPQKPVIIQSARLLTP